MYFGLCLQPPRIEEFSVGTIPKANTDDAVTEGVSQHDGEHQHTVLLKSIAYEEWLGVLTVVVNSRVHAIMELLDHRNELGGASKLGHDLPQPLTADVFKRYG